MKIKLISDRLAEEGLRMEIDIMPPYYVYFTYYLLSITKVGIVFGITRENCIFVRKLSIIEL